MKYLYRYCACLALLLLTWAVWATETENLGMSILPPPGPVVIDGRINDWDLSGGLFGCSDVENQREKMAIWLHGMYDAEHLYLLARWKDETPMNNPGSTKGNYGWDGDCLQFRIITAPGTPQERTSHWTCWMDRDKLDVMDATYGKELNEGSIRDAKVKGAQQAFLRDADGKGYTQEIAIPLNLIAQDGVSLTPGGSITITFEPNFTIGINGRWTLKDNFKPGITPDRVFTFMANQVWGPGTLVAKGHIAPHAVRLSDKRTFPVTMMQGQPGVDWTGIIKAKVIKGFKAITFTMPEDGYISLNIQDAAGAVVRQLLNCAFYTKGAHTVQWDGLTTTNWRTPVPAGHYRWMAIWHKGIGLKLHGWADNSGSAPWDSTPTANWGGDEGVPCGCTADGDKVYLGWGGAEAGKAIVTCDLKGNVVWKASRAGMSGATLLAVDQGTVYAQNGDGDIFRVASGNGGFTTWDGIDNSPDIFIKDIWPNGKAPERVDALEARNGNVFLVFTAANTVLVLDGKNGHVSKTFAVSAPVDLKTVDGKSAYVISGGTAALALNLEAGATTPFIQGLQNARALAIGKDGSVYVGLREPHNQVLVYSADGKQTATIGRDGGRALLGKWTPDGMAFINNMALDAEGKLWVTEADAAPKRISVWNTTTGQLVKELFGPTSYGALGGAICPTDANVMVGAGCEWKLDAKTGQSTCTSVITREGMEVSRFAKGANGNVYLCVAGSWAFNISPLRIYERVGEGDYKLRDVIFYADADGKEIPANELDQANIIKKTMLWADANGDGQRQPEEISGANGTLRFSGWYMGVTPDLTLYCGKDQFKVTGFTACGAPQFALSKPTAMPIEGLGSADGRLVFQNGEYLASEGWNHCYDIASGKLLWTYPDNFVGVHGSHNACPPEPGMIRGSFNPCAVVKLPAPLGNVWVVATNVGEWHLLTEWS